VILIFVIGEMLWIPASQAIVAGLAPADLRGGLHGRLRQHVHVTLVQKARGGITITASS
jgi:hypothetical protein